MVVVLAAFSYACVIDNASIVRSVRFVYDCSSLHTLPNLLKSSFCWVSLWYSSSFDLITASSSADSLSTAC